MKKVRIFSVLTIFLTNLIIQDVSYAQSRRDANINIPFENVERFHARVLCGEHETKKLIMGGIQDGFSLPQDPYVNGQPLGTNPNNNQTFPNAGGYDSTKVNHHFFDRITIPSFISRGYLLFALRYNGYELQDNDTIFFGDSASRAQSPSNYSGFNSPLVNLQSFGFQKVGDLNSLKGATYLASLSDISFINGQTFLNFVQSGNGSINVDTYLQDDTSIDFIAYSVCIRETKAVVESSGCEGEDTEINSVYGPLKIKEYCEGDPITLSTNGTTPSDNFWVHLQTFDPMTWQGLNAITPNNLSGWQCTNNQNCPPPAYIMPTNYANPPGQNLPANNPGEIYHFKFAVGPVWAEDHYFFRTKKCKVRRVPDKRRSTSCVRVRR